MVVFILEKNNLVKTVFFFQASLVFLFLFLKELLFKILEIILHIAVSKLKEFGEYLQDEIEDLSRRNYYKTCC